MLPDELTASVRGRFDPSQLSYSGAARFEIHKDGNYEFDQHFEKVFVNGQDMGFRGAKGNVFLARGAYQIRVQESGARLKSATLSIKNKQSGEAVPVFNYGADIDQFLRQTMGPWKVVEVSAWEAKEVVLGAEILDLFPSSSLGTPFGEALLRLPCCGLAKRSFAETRSEAGASERGKEVVLGR